MNQEEEGERSLGAEMASLLELSFLDVGLQVTVVGVPGVDDLAGPLEFWLPRCLRTCTLPGYISSCQRTHPPTPALLHLPSFVILDNILLFCL